MFKYTPFFKVLEHIMEESGWSEHYDGKDEEKKDVASKKLQELEESYDSEDERMLVDLIKIRKSLWT